MKRVALSLLFLFLLQGVAQAQLIPVASLRQYKINPNYFQIDRFSKDGATLFGLEKLTNPKEIRSRGGAYVMRILHFDPKMSVKSVESIDLPIQRFHQITYNDETTQALLASESGANLYLIDIPGKKVKKIAGHTKGTPGFRVADPLLYFVDGFFYAYGYFYDENDLTTQDTYLVKIDLARSGVEMFEKTLNLRDVRHVLGISSFGAYLPPDRVVWGVRRKQDGLLELKLYDNGKAKILDSGIGFTGVVHAGDRIFYVVKKPGKQAEWNAVVRDIKTNNLWNVGDKKTPYTYHFISTDGTTVTVAQLDFKRMTMNFFFARREHDFRLQPISSLQDVPFGTFRLSPDGKLFAFYSPGGVVVDRVR